MAKHKKTETPAVRMDYSTLDPAIKLALDEKAKEMADKEIQESLEDAYLLAAKEKAKAAKLAELGINAEGEETFEHKVNLPPNAVNYSLNGVTYRHGEKVKVTRGVLNMILDAENRGWYQEDIRRGDTEDSFGLARQRAGGALQ